MKKHDSMRGWFAYELYQQMKKNKDIWLIVGDLGYKIFDRHFEDFPERCINSGAAEQAMMGIACGLALEGKIPFVYSITTFLLYRPFETIRTYINHEKLNVKLIGSGRDKDYAHDGISHWSEDAFRLFNHDDEYHSLLRDKGVLNNILSFWPEDKEQIPSLVQSLVDTDIPCFLSLRR
jgi:transketolase